MSQSQPLPPQAVADRSLQLAEYTSEAGSVVNRVSTQPPMGSSQLGSSQERLPLVCDPGAQASRKSSLASFSPVADSSIFTTSPSFSSKTDTLSPESPCASFSQGVLNRNIWTASPGSVSSTSSFPQFEKPSNGIPTSSMASLPQKTSPSLSLPKDTPDVQGSNSWKPSTTPLSRRLSGSSLKSPALSSEAKSQISSHDRRHAINSASNQNISRRASSASMISPSKAKQNGTLKSLYTGDPAANWLDTSSTSQNTTFAQTSYLGDPDSMTGNQSSFPPGTVPSIQPSIKQRGSNELQSVSKPRFVRPGSNDPWKDDMATDEALAKSLQQEEFKDIQMERDLILAYALANGTAKDEDVELAYFMARETATLIASTETVPQDLPAPKTSIPTSSDLLCADDKTSQMQLDLFEARQLEKELRAQESAYEASLSEARRLQAEYDKEVREEEAWEEWKKCNIEECIVCGDEQHREELLRPCEHGYCESCLQDGFKNALTSRTPLKCCKGVLSIDDCSGLSTEFVAAYEEMMLELTTPNAIYCCNAQCATFLPPSAIVGDVGLCGKCRTQTCRHCRKLLHPGTFCKEDKETKAVKELAKKKGWKTCPGCNHLIERQSGCLHMVCSRCQTAFCYRCSKPWKLCESTCPDG